jgi:hypothetical protein
LEIERRRGPGNEEEEDWVSTSNERYKARRRHIPLGSSTLKQKSHKPNKYNQ